MSGNIMIRLPAKVKLDLDILQRTNNFPGLERMVKLAKQKHPEITRKEIKTFLDADVAKQLTKVQQAKPSDGHIVAFVPNENIGRWIYLIYLDTCMQINIIDTSYVVLMCSLEKPMQSH